MVFLLDAQSTATLHIDTTEIIGLNDYELSSILSDSQRQLSSLKTIYGLKYSKIQFNAISDCDYFYQIIPISLQFEKSGLYNISAKLQHSNSPTIHTIFVSNSIIIINKKNIYKKFEFFLRPILGHILSKLRKNNK